MKSNHIFRLILFGLFCSCNQALQPLELEIEQKLVVWCYLHPDSVATALVSKTGEPFSSKKDRIVNNATVLLIENGIIADTLKYVDSTLYRSTLNFKPKIKEAYAIRIESPNLKTIVTKADIVPEAPKLLKYIVNDSFAKIDNSRNLIQLQLFTDTPQYYYAYGLSPAMYKGLNYLGVYGDAIKVFDLKSNACNSSFKIQNHYFKLPNCDEISSNYYEYRTEVNPIVFRKQKLKFSMCNVTKQGAEIILGSYNYYASNFDDFYDTNLFWNPSAPPPTDVVENGYGFLVCYNTLNIELQF
jgi:Domain of unknown function (DUF4249)